MSVRDETQPPHARRNAGLILLAVVVVAAVVVGAVLLATRSTKSPQAAPEPSPTSTTSAPPAPPSTPTPTPTPTKTVPHKPVVPHEAVAPAAPTAFTYTNRKFTIKASVCGMENVRPLDPPGEQHHTVCWVQHDFGYAPASKGRAKGTTYVLGHAWGQDPLEVLNKISELATTQALPAINSGRSHMVNGVPTFPVTRLTGDVLTLRTPRGTLKYTVRDAYAVPKSQAGYVQHLVDENVKNRVVLITCAELNHVDYDYNVIVEAYLTSSKAVLATG